MAKKATPAVTEPLELTPEEIAAVIEARKVTGTPAPSVSAHQELANALITAIEATRPPAKKTTANRVRGGPWEPKDGTKKPKLKRKMFQHGIDLSESTLSSEEINLLNKIKPGSYLGGFVRVIKRKDRSLDVDYPVRTASQRLRLVNNWGIRSFSELLQRLIDEAAKPKSINDDDDE